MPLLICEMSFIHLYIEQHIHNFIPTFPAELYQGIIQILLGKG